MAKHPDPGSTVSGTNIDGLHVTGEITGYGYRNGWGDFVLVKYPRPNPPKYGRQLDTRPMLVKNIDKKVGPMKTKTVAVAIKPTRFESDPAEGVIFDPALADGLSSVLLGLYPDFDGPSISVVESPAELVEMFSGNDLGLEEAVGTVDGFGADFLAEAIRLEQEELAAV